MASAGEMTDGRGVMVIDQKFQPSRELFAWERCFGWQIAWGVRDSMEALLKLKRIESLYPSVIDTLVARFSVLEQEGATLLVTLGQMAQARVAALSLVVHDKDLGAGDMRKVIRRTGPLGVAVVYLTLNKPDDLLRYKAVVRGQTTIKFDMAQRLGVPPVLVNQGGQIDPMLIDWQS